MSDPSPASETHSSTHVDPVDKTSASHSPVPLDSPGGPANPTLPGEKSQDSGADPTKQSFRPNADADLDAEVEAALSGTDVAGMLDQSATENAVADRLRGTQAGTVSRVDLSKGEVLIDLGGKHQAIVPARQFEDEMPVEGEFIEVDLEGYDPDEGLYRAHRKGAARRVAGWDDLNVGQVVEATVTGMNKGGLECRVGPTAIRAFIPAGQVDTQFHKDISIFIGEKFPVKVTKLDKAARNLVLSRRAVVEAERGAKREETMKALTEGQVLTGTVKTVKDFGAFVDLGGVDGLLHVTQLTHRRMANAGDFIKEGDSVEVRVDSIDPAPAGKKGKGGPKIGLSLSHRPPNPWESAEANYSPGTGVTGRVTRVENFGCFVEVEDGLEGLLPASEMSWRRIRHPSEVANVGDQLRLTVIQVDPQSKKLTLSLKQADGDPWGEATNKYAPDTVHKGKVTQVADFGAFVEFEPGVEGLIHISELADHRVRRVEDVVQLGSEVNARVLQVDPDKRRLRLSLKERDHAAEQAAAEDVQQRQQQKKQREKRLSKKPLKGGLDF